MIILEPFERADCARLIGWVPSAEFLMQWAGWAFTFPLDEAQIEKHLQGAQTVPPLRRIFKGIDTSSRAVVGHIELNNIDLRNRSATISRVLVGDPARRGQGIGTAMMRQILAIGFGELNLHRIELYVFDFNQAAIACYSKLGFVREGRLRDARRMGDTFWSVDLMSILEAEWQGHK